MKTFTIIDLKDLVPKKELYSIRNYLRDNGHAVDTVPVKGGVAKVYCTRDELVALRDKARDDSYSDVQNEAHHRYLELMRKVEGL